MRYRMLSCSILVALLTIQPAQAQSRGSFVSTGDMAVPRWGHTATLLPDGTVLITGGSGETESLSSAELYNPATGRFSAAGTMITPRRTHTATLLPSGKVLIAGGWTSSAELFDPATGIFTATGSMIRDHGGHTATLLSDGRVLIAGGMHASPPWPTSSAAELYDPSTGIFSPAGPHAGAGSMYTTAGGPIWPSANLLPDGKVLLVANNPPEVYDPSTNTFALTQPLVDPTYRYGMYWHNGTTLADGRVLVTGGKADDMSCDPVANAEIFDASSGTFTALGAMTAPREGHSGTLLRDGAVLLAGGGAGWCFQDTFDHTELFDPETKSFVDAGKMTRRRSFHTATLLPDGSVLLAGGLSYWPHEVGRSAELFRPRTPPARGRGGRR